MTRFLKRNLPGRLRAEEAETATRVIEAICSDRQLDPTLTDLAIEAILDGGVKSKKAWERLSAV